MVVQRPLPSLLLLSLAGLVLGLVAATLVTEIPEERMDGGPALKTVKWSGVALATVAFGALAWWRREGATGALWAATTVAVPAWTAFYEVDNTEAMLGLGIAHALSWATLVLPRPGRIGAALVVAAACLLPVVGIEVPTSFIVAGIVSAVATAALALRGFPRAALMGVVAWSLILGILAWPGAMDQASVGDFRLLVGALVALAGVALLVLVARNRSTVAAPLT